MNVDNISKERFLQAKKKVTKKYPGAKTLIDPNGQYFVATANGRDINNLQVSQTINGFKFDQTEGCDTDYGINNFNTALNKVCEIPHSDSVKEAWLKTEVAIKSYHVVERNSNKFSDEKVTRKMAKDFE
tara:strand:- start:1216 stop:1602 length:387 start_codon:yes stop_codon:yes gene_type:complete